MRFELFALPILAVLVDAAAIQPSSSSSSKACSTCPVTIKDTAAAIASVYSQMSAQSPKQAVATTTVVGSPVASTDVAKMTTTTTPSVGATSTAPSSKSSTIKRQRRATASTSTTTTSPSSACATQLNFGYKYVPSSGDATKFLKDNTLRQQAMGQSVPAGYWWNFAGYYASQLQSGYMYSADLSSYNVTQCAAVCSGDNACKGFNIYFERDPTVLPAAACPNPAPQTNVRCAFYNQAVSEANAVNIGSWRNSFAVLITGGNGYSKQ